MTRPDDLERCLAIARGACQPSEAARVRVRAHMASRGAFDAGRGLFKADPSPAPRSRAAARLTTAILVGAGFLGGYWLGVHRSGGSLELDGDAPSSGAVAPNASSAVDSAAVQPSESSGQVSRGASSSAVSSSAVSSSAVSSSAVSSPAVSSSAVSIAAPSAAAAPTAAVTTAQPQSPSRPVRASARRNLDAVDSAADELALLSRAERSLRAGEALLALAFLDELDRRYPSSTFLEERAASRLLADCTLETPSARERAQLFLRQHPATVYSDRLQRTCAPEPSTDSSRSSNPSGPKER